MTQHPTSIHLPSPPMQYLVRATSPSRSLTNTSQRLLFCTEHFLLIFITEKETLISAMQPKWHHIAAVLHSPWKVSVVSFDTKHLSTGHLALLCSRHHGVTTCIHLYRAVITQMDVCTRSRGAFQRLPVLQDTARFPATSRPDRHRPDCFVEGADRPIHAWKLNARLDTHSVGGEKTGIGAWVGFLHCASDGGSYHNKWLQ